MKMLVGIFSQYSSLIRYVKLHCRFDYHTSNGPKNAVLNLADKNLKCIKSNCERNWQILQLSHNLSV